MHADPAAGSTRQLVSSSVSLSLNMPKPRLPVRSNITVLTLSYPSILCPGIRAQPTQTNKKTSDACECRHRSVSFTDGDYQRWEQIVWGVRIAKRGRRRLTFSSLCLFWWQRSLEETVGFQQPLSSCWRCSSPLLNLYASPPGSSFPPDVYVSASQIFHVAGNTQKVFI